MFWFSFNRIINNLKRVESATKQPIHPLVSGRIYLESEANHVEQISLFILLVNNDIMNTLLASSDVSSTTQCFFSFISLLFFRDNINIVQFVRVGENQC